MSFTNHIVKLGDISATLFRS